MTDYGTETASHSSFEERTRVCKPELQPDTIPAPVATSLEPFTPTGVYTVQACAPRISLQSYSISRAGSGSINAMALSEQRAGTRHNAVLQHSMLSDEEQIICQQPAKGSVKSSAHRSLQ
jgi:hypothetical protein